jgi:hypothetical protein
MFHVRVFHKTGKTTHPKVELFISQDAGERVKLLLNKLGELSCMELAFYKEFFFVKKITEISEAITLNQPSIRLSILQQNTVESICIKLLEPHCIYIVFI